MSSIRTAITLASLAALLALSQGDASAAEKKLKLRATQDAATAVVAAPKALKGAAGPDLVIVSVLPEPDPVEGLPNQGYCSKVPAGGPADEVLFAVRNNGDAPSPLTTVRVTFATGQSDDKTIVALAPGQMSHVHINIPDGCYPATAHGSCNYAIAADADTQVNESSESNNVVLSLCLLPGT
jgi:hypothetical protein